MSIEFIWRIIQAAIGLGLLIFVHELGHFLVAKYFGVKCEKFMVGFDFFGLKLSRKWGETEYGIGIVPLGGYVKMLGQDDNPSHIAEQLEKSHAEGNGFQGVEVVGPGGEKHVVDRRSYIAKSVPQRMAIISAGVVMNVLFAVIFATIAFGLGVPETPSVISKTVPGSAAWQAGLRTGDKISRIADIENPSFAQLTGKVTLADLEAGVPLVVRRATGEEQSLTLRPQQKDGKGLAKIGILSGSSLTLHAKTPTIPGSVASQAEGGFEAGDKIMAVDGEPIDNFRELAAILATNPTRPLEFTVQRQSASAADQPAEPATSAETRAVTVPPSPLKRFGLVMAMGPVVAIEENSPAAEAGLTVGQPITRVTTPEGTYSTAEGEQQLDPSTLPAVLQPLAADGSQVTIATTGESQDRSTSMTLRVADWLESIETPGAPMSIPELGIAYEVRNEVVDVLAGSPAEKAGLAAGDKLVAAKLLIPKEGSEKANEVEIPLGDELNWPMILSVVQDLPAGTRVLLTYERNGQQREVTLEPAVDAVDPTYVAERGLIFEPLRRVRRGETFSQQLSYGWNATVEALLLVYRFLQKLWEGQVPATALGGPKMIAEVAFASTGEGFSTLLMFMTMLSANLAVVNFLPIPVLDGGHMVFLAYEGIFRRPPNERIVVALHMAGFAMIVGLMSFLILLDFGFIQRNL